MAQENKVYRRVSPGIEGHVISKESIPTPKYDQVLVRIKAISLNYRDLLIAWGKYIPGFEKNGAIPISDGAGDVVSVGEGVKNFKKGDRVLPNFISEYVAGRYGDVTGKSLSGVIDGVAAQYVVVAASTLVHIPEHLSYEEAATLPCAALTAWNSLFEGPKVIRPGETLLIEGTGGVSIFGLQLAVAAGARVIVTSSSNEKLKKAKALGAAEVINYKEQPDWDKEVLRLTNNVGVDHIIEVGGVDTVQKAVNAARQEASISLVGGVSGMAASYGTLPILFKTLNIRGILIGSSEMFERMNAAISFNKIKPQVDKVFDFDQLQDALKYLEKGSHFGKVVVRVD